MVCGPPLDRAAVRLLVALLMATTLAGCLGGAPAPGGDDVTPEAPQAAPPGTPPPIDDPLPVLTLDLVSEPPYVALHIGLDGDPDTIVHHTIDWDDGLEPDSRDGPPRATHLRNLAPPEHWSDPAKTYTPEVTIFSADGHSRSRAATIDIPAPDNQPPNASVEADTRSDQIPAHIRFTLSASDTDGEVRHWRFDPGDGTETHMDTGRPPETIPHIYRSVGTHIATLTVTDDAGAKTTTNTTLDILPPQDLGFWTHSATTAYRHDANGALRGKTALVACSTAPCPAVAGADTTPQRFIAAIADGTASRLHVYDGTSGMLERRIPLPSPPQDLHTDPAGTAWTTHADGNITWTDPKTGSQETTRLAVANATYRLAFSPDGTTWILESGPPARLHHLDPATGWSDALTIPGGVHAEHLAVNHKHGAALVVDDQGKAWIGMPTLYGPRLGAVIPLDGDATPSGITCPAGQDLCWVAMDGTPSTLVGIDIKAATTTPWMAPATARLPEGLHPGPPLNTQDALVLPVNGTHHGYLILDPKSGSIRAEVTQAGSSDAPRGAFSTDAYPTLVYHLDPDTDAIAILDTSTGRIVHRATDAGGEHGPYRVRNAG